MSTLSRERSVLLQATWQQYIELRDEPENDYLRMTFGHGSLELMSPTRLHLYSLRASKRYVAIAASRAVAGFPVDRLVEVVNRRSSADETTLLREFRAACRKASEQRE